MEFKYKIEDGKGLEAFRFKWTGFQWSWSYETLANSLHCLMERDRDSDFPSILVPLERFFWPLFPHLKRGCIWGRINSWALPSNIIKIFDAILGRMKTLKRNNLSPWGKLLNFYDFYESWTTVLSHCSEENLTGGYVNSGLNTLITLFFFAWKTQEWFFSKPFSNLPFSSRQRYYQWTLHYRFSYLWNWIFFEWTVKWIFIREIFLWFFRAFFNLGLSSTVELRERWPLLLIEPTIFFSTLLLNTPILLRSRVKLTWGHPSNIGGDYVKGPMGQRMTILKAVYFEVHEKFERKFRMNDSFMEGFFFYLSDFAEIILQLQIFCRNSVFCL